MRLTAVKKLKPGQRVNVALHREKGNQKTQAHFRDDVISGTIVRVTERGGVLVHLDSHGWNSDEWFPYSMIWE